MLEVLDYLALAIASKQLAVLRLTYTDQITKLWARVAMSDKANSHTGSRSYGFHGAYLSGSQWAIGLDNLDQLHATAQKQK